MRMQDVRVRLSSSIAIAVLVGAGAFAAGRSSTSTVVVHEPAAAPVTNELGDPHGGDSPTAMPDTLPPGHPAVDPGTAPPPAAAPDTTLVWKVPARWQTAANPSSMRIATYHVPHAPGDEADADVSVTQAGGTVEANVDRWIGQFGPEAKKNAKQTTRTIAGFEVTIVEVEGAYNGGMAPAGMSDPKAPVGKAALLGAIVATPGMPHFFKITGPAKTVFSARAELDALLASISSKS